MNENMRCEEVEELTGAYALGALTPGELSAVEVHLSGCEKHPEIAEFVATVRALSLAPPEMEPPGDLKTRLMAAVNADLAAERAAASPSISEPVRRKGWLERLFGSPRLGYVLAAAAAVVVALVLIASPWGGGDDDNTLVRTFDDGSISGEITYDTDEPTASMTVEGLDPAPEGSVYQVWAITGVNPVSIGFVEVPEDGAASSSMDVQLVEGQVVAVTVEPDGGSPQPTTEPILAVEI